MTNLNEMQQKQKETHQFAHGEVFNAVSYYLLSKAPEALEHGRYEDKYCHPNVRYNPEDRSLVYQIIKAKPCTVFDNKPSNEELPVTALIDEKITEDEMPRVVAFFREVEWLRSEILKGPVEQNRVLNYTKMAQEAIDEIFKKGQENGNAFAYENCPDLLKPKSPIHII